MKSFITILFICVLNIAYAQKIFDYEQKIELTESFGKKQFNFKNPEDGVVLSGTLIYPINNFNKVVIIVPGSGKDTRHSHFDIASAFLFNGIAIYRFDDRGVGQSGGKYNRQKETATSLRKDVVAAFEELRKLDVLSGKKIGILGHSLGGIASIGALGEGCNFDFLIQVATPVEDNGAFLKYQVSTDVVGFYRVKNKTPDEIIHFIDVVRKTIRPDEDHKTSKRKIKGVIKKLNFKKGRHIINPVIIDLMKQNHESTYMSSKTPILFIMGSKDKIVSSENEIKTLKKLNNPNISIALINEVNHYLSIEKENVKQYQSPYRMTSEASDQIINWTLNQ